MVAPPFAVSRQHPEDGQLAFPEVRPARQPAARLRQVLPPSAYPFRTYRPPGFVKMQRDGVPTKFPDAEAAALLVACHGTARAARVAVNIATALAVAGDDAGADMWTRVADRCRLGLERPTRMGRRMGNEQGPELNN